MMINYLQCTAPLFFFTCCIQKLLEWSVIQRD